MKVRKCVHPSRAVNLMKEFLFTACPDIYETKVFTLEEEAERPIVNIDAEDWWEQWNKEIEWEETHGHYEKFKITPKMYKMSNTNFCVHPYDYFDDGEDTVRFGYNFDCLFDNSSRGTIVVVRDMEKRGKHMRGFSRITKILLHEMGHLATHEEIHEKYTAEELSNLKNENHAKRRGNYGYVTLPDEYAATQWAIDWLKDPNNRKTAKAFEKKFWACFE